MWILIYWVCMGGACHTNNVAAFSTEEICQQAAERLEKKSAKAVCVNSDISYFE